MDCESASMEWSELDHRVDDWKFAIWRFLAIKLGWLWKQRLTIDMGWSMKR